MHHRSHETLPRHETSTASTGLWWKLLASTKIDVVTVPHVRTRLHGHVAGQHHNRSIPV
jgi:hypothetical protein